MENKSNETKTHRASSKNTHSSTSSKQGEHGKSEAKSKTSHSAKSSK